MSCYPLPVLEQAAQSVKRAEGVKKALQSFSALERLLSERGYYQNDTMSTQPMSMSVGFIADGSRRIDRNMIKYLGKCRQILQDLANGFVHMYVAVPEGVDSDDWERVKRRAIREVLEWKWQKITRRAGVKAEFVHYSKGLELIDTAFEVYENPSETEVQLLAEYLRWPVDRVMARYRQNHQRMQAYMLVASMFDKDMPYTSLIVELVQGSENKEKSSLASQRETSA